MKLFFENKLTESQIKTLAKDYYYEDKANILADPEEYKSIIRGVKNLEDAFKYFKEQGGSLYIPAGTALQKVRQDYYYSYYKIIDTPLTVGILKDGGEDMIWTSSKPQVDWDLIDSIIQKMGWPFPHRARVGKLGYTISWSGLTPFDDYREEREDEDYDKVKQSFINDVKNKTGYKVRILNSWSWSGHLNSSLLIEVPDLRTN